MVYTHLTQEERYQIYALLRQGESQKSIADQLDRHPATISRELRRNRGQRGYRARQAQQLAHERRPVTQGALRHMTGSTPKRS